MRYGFAEEALHQHVDIIAAMVVVKYAGDGVFVFIVLQRMRSKCA
jgi:hypothetical protein